MLESLRELKFGEERLIWGLVLIPLLLGLFLWNEKRSRDLMGKLVASRLQAALADSVSVTGRRVRFFLLLTGLACVIVSLAQPQFGYTFEQSHRQGRDVIIAIDTSKSMLAEDVKPSRLAGARFAIEDLMKLLNGDRVGLIAFAGNAFLQAPLTIDYSALLSSVRELDTEIIPRGGTNIAEAIKIAADAFGKGESENRALILLTDGEELEKSAVDAARAQAANFRVFTVGVGTAEGAIIPERDEQGGTRFVKDEHGQIVKTKLDETRLREIAEATGGFYVQLQNGPETMKNIVTNGLGKMQEHDIDARQARRPIERYQWPLSAGLFLLAISALISERKRRIKQPGRSAKIAAALCLMMLPNMAKAKNSGVEAYEQEHYDQAYDIFSRQLRLLPHAPAAQYNLGTAAYKMEKDSEALAAFSTATLTGDPSLRARAETNLAHTLYRIGDKKKEQRDAKLGDWKNALAHYDEALKIEPENEKIQGYREYVRRKIEELEKEQPKPDQKKEDQNKQQQKKDDKQDEKKSQEKKDQQSKSEQKEEQQKQGDSKQEKKEEGQGQPKSDEQKKQEQQKDSDQSKQAGSDPKDGQQGKPGDEKADQKPSDSGKDERAENKPQSGSPPQEPKNGEEKKGESSGQPGAKPTPSDRKLTGDIQAADKSEKPGQEAEAQAAEESEAKEGEMTPRQAVMLLDSLKAEDDRVLLNERKKSAPVGKDW